jgi:hypothetical protein
MRRLLFSLAVLSLLAAQEVTAQGSPALVKYGKWLLLAGAVGMNVAAANAHHDADEFFDQLDDRCTTDHALCALGPNGAYLDAESERLYQSSVTMDQRARTWLIGGEAAALGAAVMFVWEFARPKGAPGNIPFEPRVSIRAERTELGLLVRF